MKIGNVEFGKYPLFLAPMEDVTDIGFRLLCKKLGADMVYSEFVAADALVRMVNKSLEKLTVCEDERPVTIQIYGKEPEPVAEAARIVVERAHPDVLDLNFGCPVKRVAGKGAGAGMLQNVPKMLEITRAVVNAVNVPVTVKTRLGWDENHKIIVDLAEQLQDCGIQALAIHGRTRAQMYTGEADWTLIGEVKNNPRMKIPIIGNGDVDSGPKAKQMFDDYGVDGVMIGRATYGRPWIFREIRHYLNTGEILPQPSVLERIAIAKEHLAKSVEIKGDRVGVFEMRRHLSNYFKGLPNFKETRMKLVTLTDVDELQDTISSIADRWGDYDFGEVVPPPLSHDI